MRNIMCSAATALVMTTSVHAEGFIWNASNLYYDTGVDDDAIHSAKVGDHITWTVFGFFSNTDPNRTVNGTVIKIDTHFVYVRLDNPTHDIFQVWEKDARKMTEEEIASWKASQTKASDLLCVPQRTQLRTVMMANLAKSQGRVVQRWEYTDHWLTNLGVRRNDASLMN